MSIQQGQDVLVEVRCGCRNSMLSVIGAVSDLIRKGKAMSCDFENNYWILAMLLNSDQGP